MMENPTKLEQKIAQQIAHSGKLSIAEFIALTMSDKQHGYYATQSPFGKKGDFITAPEISQLFGEMLAVWVIATWQALGQPEHFALTEAGPGRGTLADDILRTIAKISPNCFQSLQLVLIEISPILRQQQQEKLRSYQKPIIWLDDLSKLNDEFSQNKPDTPLIFIANELLDALPIHQYQKTKAGWHEKFLILDKQNKLCFTLGIPLPLPNFLPNRAFAEHCLKAPEGAVVEISPARTALVHSLSQLLNKYRGSALFIDYGSLSHGFNDSLQAIKNHNYTDILENIGTSDISSHVDFAALILAAQKEGCLTATLSQAKFLIQLGLLERAGQLGADKSIKVQQQITEDVERLAAPDKMGELFKVLCITDKDTKMPPFRW